MFPPNRILCLTEETVETLYLLGEQGRPHRRDLRLCRAPTAGPPREASSERFHLSEYRHDPHTETRPRPDVLRSAGGYRRRSRSPWTRGPCLQSANHFREPRHDPNAGRDGRCERTGSAASTNARDALGRCPSPYGGVA